MRMRTSLSLVLIFLITVVTLHFLVNSLQAPQNIGSSNTFATISANHQRKLFYANGFHWIFFCDGSQIFYSSSSDGISWNKPVAVLNGSSSSAMSVWFDQKVHYVYAPGFLGGSVLYRQGEIAGKEIVWEEYHTVINGLQGSNPSETETSSCSFYNGYCIKDSLEYPWAACIGSEGASWYAYAVKAQVTDGSAWEQPQRIFGPFATPRRVTILPLDDGKVYAICAGTNGVDGRLWNGTSWKSREIVTSSGLVVEYGYSAVSHDDKVHLVLLEESTHNILYLMRTEEMHWREEVVVEQGLDYRSLPTICIDESNGNLYCFWIYNDTVWLKEKLDGVWKNPLNPFGVEFGKLRGISCFYKVSNGMVGVAWLTQHNNLYEVKYRFLLV